MQRNKDNVWKIGEEMAKKYLENNGYQIIDQNYRTRYSEIDIVVKKDDILIFVEVRTKRKSDFVSPEESINHKKLKKLYFNAEAYVSAKKYKGSYRVDAVCIVLKPDDTVEKIEHYKEI